MNKAAAKFEIKSKIENVCERSTYEINGRFLSLWVIAISKWDDEWK